MNRPIYCLTAAAVVVLAACSPRGEEPDTTYAQPPADSATAAVAIDPAIAPAIAGEDGWNYVQRATADLDGNGVAEQVVLTARVELYRGRPAWDDGQPWQVYIESPGGDRTYVYAQRLQLGTLTMRLSSADSGQVSSIVLLEQLPDRMTVYEATYGGPSEARVETRFQRMLDPRGPLAGPQLP